MIASAADRDFMSSQRALFTCGGETRRHTSAERSTHTLGVALRLKSWRKRGRPARHGQWTPIAEAPHTGSATIKSP